MTKRQSPDATAKPAGMSLYVFLFRLIGLSVLPLLLLSAYFAVNHYQRLRAERDSLATDLVNNFASSIDQHLHSRISALQMLAVSPLLEKSSRWNDLYLEAQGFHQSFGSHVILADTQRHMLFNTRVPFGTPLPMLPQPEGQAAVPTAMATGKPAVGNVFWGPVAKEPLVAIAVPAQHKGRIDFLLLTLYETQHFQERIDQVTLPLGWGLSLLDNRGEVIARRVPAGADSATDRVGRFVAKSGVSPWSAVLEIPRSTYQAPLISAAVAMLVAFLVAILVSLWGGLWASRRLTRAVASLVEPLADGAGTYSSAIREIATVRRLLDEADERGVMAEVSLSESETRFKATFEQAAVGIALVAPDGHWFQVNGKLCQILGYSHEELLQISFQDITHPDDLNADLACVRQMLAREIETYTMEKRYLHKEGGIVWVNLTVALIWKADGTPDYFISVVEDIRARKAAERSLAAMAEEQKRARFAALNQMEDAIAAREMAESANVALRDSEQRFRVTFEQAAVGMAVVAPDGHWLRVNQKLCDIVGYSLDELLCRTVQEITHPDDLSADLSCVQQLLSGEIGTYALEKRYLCKDDTIVWVNIAVSLVCHADGRPNHFIAVIEDIQRRKGAEEALQKSEERLRLALDATSDGLWDWDLRSGMIYRSPRYYELAERQSDEGAADFEFFKNMMHPDDQHRVMETIEAHKQGKTAAIEFDFRLLRPLGEVKWMGVRGRAVERDALGAPLRIVGTLTDISERKRVEEEIRAGKAKLEVALASMNDAVSISDTEGRFIDFNEAFATFHKFASKEECVRTLGEYLELLDVYSSRGELLPLEQWAVSRALRGETATNVEFSLRRKDTNEAWVGSYSFAPIRDKDGVIVGSVVTARDVTEMKAIQDKINLLNESLEQRVVERTAELTMANHELDSFAYAVSHDLRAPLRAMNGFSQALMEDYGDKFDGEAKVYFEQISIASSKMGELIDGILALSRSTRGELQHDLIDLSALSANILAELVDSEPERMLNAEIEPGLAVYGDARMIEAVMRNLLDNAWKYTGKTEAPTIRVYSGKVDSMPGICVADNGAGFDMVHAEQLFQPFRRLHRQDEFQGIGIGLATVQRIVHRHGGKICAHAEPGKGATFCFTLANQSEES